MAWNKLFRGAWVVVVLVVCRPACAAGLGLFESDFDEEKKPWTELQAQLPAYPALAQALPFEVPAAGHAAFYIDPKSIVVSPDGVVRYSLIVKSARGALNVSHEGLRCETREKKLYAFGRPDNTWSRNKFAKWEEIPSPTRDPQHNALYGEFFCPQSEIVNNANEGISALIRGSHPRANP